MAIARHATHSLTVNGLPTFGRKILTIVSALTVAGFVVMSESLAPAPLAALACTLVGAGFIIGAYAWFTGAKVDKPHVTSWDYSGLLLFAGFALATALGSSWMGV